MGKLACDPQRYIQLAVSERALQRMLALGVLHISDIHCDNVISKRTLQNLLLKTLTENK